MNLDVRLVFTSCFAPRYTSEVIMAKISNITEMLVTIILLIVVIPNMS